MIEFTVPGEAVPFARAGALGKRRFTPKKQADHMGVVKLFAHRAMNGAPPLTTAVSMRVEASYLHPDSWSNKKKAATKWKASKPDADNIGKLIKDAISTIVFVDDALVAKLIVTKFYGPTAFVRVEVVELGQVKVVPPREMVLFGERAEVGT